MSDTTGPVHLKLDLGLRGVRLDPSARRGIQAAVLQRRARWQEANDAPVLDDFGWLEGFKTSLPFALTGAQERVLEELKGDINSNVPMLRLLQGDVGSGKTVVAFAAMLAAVAAGRQAALMVPTEILAEQHYRNLARLLGGDDHLRSIILWGPPGSGKTTLAHIIASHTEARFVTISAVTASIKDVKAVMELARMSLRDYRGKHVVLLFYPLDWTPG